MASNEVRRERRGASCVEFEVTVLWLFHLMCEGGMNVETLLIPKMGIYSILETPKKHPYIIYFLILTPH